MSEGPAREGSLERIRNLGQSGSKEEKGKGWIRKSWRLNVWLQVIHVLQCEALCGYSPPHKPKLSAHAAVMCLLLMGTLVGDAALPCTLMRGRQERAPTDTCWRPGAAQSQAGPLPRVTQGSSLSFCGFQV